jgi:pimeloyl-ACP methyl ester carboxylesterase
MWAQVASNLQAVERKIILGYPGFGGEPQSPDVTTFEDLVTVAKQHVDRPTLIAAQSMGGVIAVMLARDLPQLVTHLVLVATSGGIGTIASTVDWRAWVRENLPELPDWFLTLDIDLTETIRHLVIPTLLIWGDTDDISPLDVGERLQRMLPNATLYIVRGADHDLIQTHAAEVTLAVDKFIRNYSLDD